jgi:type IX secretion system PorP/SprF family membrane protein
MMKSLTLILGIFIFIASTSAQSFMSQYNTNYYILNPAATGYDSVASLQLWSRGSNLQLQNFHLDALTLGMHQQIGETNSGIGLQIIYNSDFTFSSSTSLIGNYAFNLELDGQTNLRMGTGFGVIMRRDSFNYAGSGAVLGTQVSWLPTLSFGLMFEAGEWQIGLSTLNLNQPRTTKLPQNVYIPRLIYGLVRWEHEVDQDVTIIPSILIRSKDAEQSITLTGAFEALVSNMFRLGLGYRATQLGKSEYTINGITYNRSINFIIVSAGVKTGDDFSLNLTYDIPINKVGTVTYSYLEGGLIFQF